jgi:hypothetical protein
MNIFNIERSYRDKAVRRWPNVYWCIDVHDVILEGKYSLMNEGANYMPNALKVLRMLAKKDGTKLIVWTSSYPAPISKVLDGLEKEGVEIDFVNENRDCPNDKLCDFGKKFYFNILLDDKAGFEGATDWFAIEKELKRIGEWTE